MIFQINNISYPTVKELDLAHKVNPSDSKTICIIVYTDSFIDINSFEKQTVSITINNISYNNFYIRNIYYDNDAKKYTIYGEEK